ncbi:hypothetical protein [Tunturiibacter gelidoferens]|uniref:Uncharacterized protein n=1 Tax=Tunturiibacter lichenicola TaxID=2051959 RepID=A0A7Y9NLP9_9BACT|nr:hypothetical protein [Edaphobacter lichenicola]NYF51696.1 hypothetical protein [Edaphobacter lichenicola]
MRWVRSVHKMKLGVWCFGFLLMFQAFGGRAAEAETHGQAITELQPLPGGITLPVAMGRTLRAGKTRPGTAFQVKTTQRVPVSETAYLKRGAVVRGEVVASDAGDGSALHPSTLTIRFTQLSYGGRTVPLMTRAVAIANLMVVDDTFLPATGSTDRGNPNPASWTTRQVGGDEVARSGWVGPVVGSGTQTVGSADFYGVYSLPAKLEGANGALVPRAMGVFSTTAEGLYGFDQGAQLSSSGGLITITDPKGRAAIRNGDHLLLEVVAGR